MNSLPAVLRRFDLRWSATARVALCFGMMTTLPAVASAQLAYIVVAGAVSSAPLAFNRPGAGGVTITRGAAEGATVR